MERDLETLATAEGVVDRLVELAEGATSELAITVPPGTMGSVRQALERAIDDDVLVLLLASGYDPVDATDLEGLASVARRWEGNAPLTCTADGTRGLFAPGPFVAGQRADPPAAAVDNTALVRALFGEFVGNYWLSGTELYTADPAPLPAAYECFRHAVVQATLHLREGETVDARIEGRPVAGSERETVVGEIVNARQSFVYPVSSSFPAETRLGVDTDDGLVTVGGWGAIAEDYEAESVTLRER